MASAGWPERDRRAVDEELAGARALRAGQDVEQLVLALALERDDAEHLARVAGRTTTSSSFVAGRQAASGDARRHVGGPRGAGDALGGRAACPRRPRRASARRSAPRSPAVTSTTPTVSPSRRTVARSQTAAISIIRCEMKMTRRSPPRWRPTTSRTRSVRFAGRAAVISSSIRTSGSMASARARSMIRSEASGTLPRQVATGRGRSRPSSVEPVAERLERRLGQPQVGADVEVRDERRLLVDRHEAAAPRLGRRVDDPLRGRGRRCGRRRAGPRR